MTDTSTKRAEEVAKFHDLSELLYADNPEDSGSRAMHAVSAALIRALAAERDALRVENANIKDDLVSAERERNHQHGRADKNAQQYAMEQRKRENLQAERDALRAALRGLLVWAGPIAGDTRDVEQRAFEKETVAKAREALKGKGNE